MGEQRHSLGHVHMTMGYTSVRLITYSSMIRLSLVDFAYKSIAG